jgi:serine/threonine-protein kinase
MAISPDGHGRLVTYVVGRGSTTQLLLRRLEATAPAVVPGTTNALSPFFSPDSQWIGFFADGKLKKVPVAGGPPITLCDAGGGFGGTWGADGTIVFAPEAGSALQRVAAEGSTPVRVTTLDVSRGEFSHRWPEFLPDSSLVLFTVGTVGEWDEAEVVVQSLETGQRTTLLKGGTHPHYLTSGFLAYTHAGAVWTAPLDRRRLTVGPPTRAIEGVAASADGAASFAVSVDGHAGARPGHAPSRCATRRRREPGRAGHLRRRRLRRPARRRSLRDDRQRRPESAADRTSDHARLAAGPAASVAGATAASSPP